MRTLPAFTPGTIFQLVQPLAELPENLQLHSAEWSLLLATTGRHTVAQIGALFGFEPEARNDVFGSLLARELIVERPLTQAEFLAAQRTVDQGEPKTLAAFLGADHAVASGPRPPLAELPFVPLELTPEAATLAPVVSLQSRRRLSLKALMACLARGAASPEEGELNVYRTFIRLDPALLQRSGITTLRFEDDRTIEDPELLQQILASAHATLGAPCPPEVFV